MDIRQTMKIYGFYQMKFPLGLALLEGGPTEMSDFWVLLAPLNLSVTNNIVRLKETSYSPAGVCSGIVRVLALGAAVRLHLCQVVLLDLEISIAQLVHNQALSDKLPKLY